jgi:hypothetical protein
MDATLAKKLQLKPGQTLRAVHAPEGFHTDVPEAEERPASTADAAPAPGTLVFVTTFTQAEERVGPAVEAALADDLAWVAYPKAGQLGTDLNRDSLAAFMTARGVRPVRQVAIDDTWSALRFRPAAR